MLSGQLSYTTVNLNFPPEEDYHRSFKVKTSHEAPVLVILSFDHLCDSRWSVFAAV